MNFEQILARLGECADANYYPDFVKPVGVVSGDAQEMGFQLGVQMKQAFANHALILASRIKQMRPQDDILTDIARYEEILAAQSPEILAMWEGAAEGAQLPREALSLINIPNLLAPVPNQCSTISAWGSATTDGRLLCAANADGGAFTPTSFGPTLLLYPKAGHASICNGGWNSNLAMNDAGLVNMASNGGWNGARGDVGYGTIAVLSTMQLNMSCATAQEAMERITLHNAPLGAAENLHCADPSGNAYVIEATHRKAAVRRPGENGEEDYLLATNYFLSHEMAESEPKDLTRTRNAVSRYQSEQQLLREHHGQITLETLNQILSCRDYYDGQQWVRNVWDPEYSTWTPEKRSFRNDTYMQCLADPSQKTVYLRQGQSCRACSCIPYSSGQLSAVKLERTPFLTVEAAEIEAKRRIFALAAKTELGQLTMDEALRRDMDLAKEYVWKGQNYRAMAMACPTEQTRVMLCLHHAMTCYSKAQVLAGI